MIQKSSEKSSECYTCILCDYSTCRKSQYERHILTQKHKNRENDIHFSKKVPKNSDLYECICGRSYKQRPNLYRHQKTCKVINNDNNNDTHNKMHNDISSDVIQKLLHENSEIKTMLYKQFEAIREQQEAVEIENKELRNQLNELIPRVGNNIVNNTINSKQKFNINIFLNEQCKDALTINEFIDKIKVTLDDLLIIKEKGLSEGVSNIFIENMNKLSLFERPLHCTDAKRETLYIKCDANTNRVEGWSRDDENKNLREAISKVTHRQRQNLEKWVEEHPNWVNNSNEQEEYMKLVRNCTEDCKEDKIIKKLCNTVLIGSDTSKLD